VGPAPSAVRLTVTDDFGGHVIGVWNERRPRAQETVMSLLMGHVSVSTRHGGSVHSIAGLSSGSDSGGQPVDWFYYVNGVQQFKGAAQTRVHPGDHIWWDRHDWGQARSVPAVVGSFPEPFLNGIEGKRLPVRVECAAVSGDPCRTVLSRLQKLGVPAALAGISPGDEPQTLRVLVGPWRSISGDPAAQSIERGPRASGVYGRFSAAADTLTLLDERGAVTRVLGSEAGLIAATRYAEEAPVWVITGTDQAGVELAARAFHQSALENRFALALSPQGAVALPQVG
jgi:hypothetical protein